MNDKEIRENKLRLSEQQRKLVQDNHNLIYSFAWCKNIDLEEYYDVLAIGLCVAATKYDASISSFSTYAFTCMNSQYCKELRRNQRKSKIPADMILSLDEPLCQNTDTHDGNLTLSDLLPDNTVDVEKDILTQQSLQEMCDSLKEKEKNVLMSLVNGKSQSELAEQYGISRQRIGQLVSNIRKRKVSLF